MWSIVTIATRRIDDPLPTNVQHLMSRLASHYPIFYIEPPVDLMFLIRNPKFLLRLFVKNKQAFFKRRIPIILPFEYRSHTIRKINEKIFLSQLRIFIKRTIRKHFILWVFSPKHYYFIDQLTRTGSRLYFHITDEYAAFPEKAGLGTRSEIQAQENYIMQRADRIFVTSPYLARLKYAWSSKIVVVPNVADTKHFEKAQYENTPIPSDLVSIDKPVVGFVGAIDNFKVDFDLIKYCAVQNRDISFVLVGPVGRGDNTVLHNLPDENNICYLGEKAYVHLPNYLKAFDVCIIPYRLNEYTRACFPLKLQESLAAGKPLVSTNLPAVKDLTEVVYVAESKEDFSRLIRQALREDSLERIKVRQKVAMENSWEKRIQEIENIMAKDMQI